MSWALQTRLQNSRFFLQHTSTRSAFQYFKKNLTIKTNAEKERRFHRSTDSFKVSKSKKLALAYTAYNCEKANEIETIQENYIVK